MRDKNLMIAIIGCFVIAILFVLVIVWEIKKSIDHDERVQQMAKKTNDVEVADSRDFSIYETLVGDDGREMILVPEGIFSRGSDSGGFDEKPMQEIYLNAFFVDKYEVSVESYNKYRKAANYVEPSVPFFTGDSKVMKVPSHAVVGVSWHDAVNYCTWAGNRLLTEAEWEKAARGADGRIFPWGNDYEKGKSNIDIDGARALAKVGSYPGDISPYDVYDMAGNVMEWTMNWYQPYPGNTYKDPRFGKLLKVLRGNAFQKAGHYFLDAYRYAFSRTEADPNDYFENVGFRCVTSVVASN